MAHEVACVAIEIESDECFCAVGQWHDNSVSILHIVDGGKDAREVHKELLGGEILPRSVIFANFDSSRHLVIGMGDGHVYSFVFDPAKAMHASQTGEVKDAAASEEEKVLRQKKKMALGRQPVTLIPFFNRGALNVLACGDRPTVVYSKNGKIVFSPVNLPHVTGLCELNTKEFPDALAFATKEALRIGTVDEIQKLHIRTIPLGEMARRVAHHKPSRTFVVSTARYETHETTGEETEVCAIKLLDDTGFELLDSFKLDLHECAESLTPVLFTGDSRTYCAVGTGYLIPTELEPTKGRLLIFEIETTLTSSQNVPGGALSAATGASSSGSSASMVVSGRLKLVHELEVPGMVWCMTAFAGKLLCGVSFSVQLYAWTETRDGSRELKMECEHTNHVQALCLATRDNHIYVGDLMRGTSVLEYKPVDGRIEQLAMDLRPNCIMAVAILDGHHYLAAENSLNLMTVKLNTDAGATNDEREFLSPVGSFHLGDQPNAFRSGSLVMQLPDQDSLTLPSILYATVSGAIGVIASLPKELYDELLALQNAILKVVKGIGNFDHSEWRAYNDARKTSPHSNFIDGDLVEGVLDFSPEEQNRIAKAVGIPVEEMIKKIEAVSQATH
jgi:DNA damage-binding protein 1